MLPSSRALLALVVSTVISSAVGLGMFRWLRADTQASATSSDFTLAFQDALGRPISSQNGKLRLSLDPFTVYRNAPSQQTSSYTIDEHGFRGGLGESNRPRVFLIGGSTAFGQEIPGDDHTISGQLRQQMESVTTVNAGVVGYLSGQELALMVQHLDEFAPAGYIVLDGWNELFDQYLYWPRPPGRLGFNNTFFDIENRLHQWHAQSVSLPLLPGATPAPDVEAAFQQAIEAYLVRIERMHAFAAARQARFLWVPQPELGAKKTKSPEEELALVGWNRAYAYGDRGFSIRYAELVRRAREHASATGIPFFDPNESERWNQSAEHLFSDPVHLTRRGAELLATLLADDLKSRSWTFNNDSQSSAQRESEANTPQTKTIPLSQIASTP